MPIRQSITDPQSKKLLASCWASIAEDDALAQARRVASLPFVERPVALMADMHWGKGATIGSVIATRGAIIPAAVGVDLGCVDADTEYLSPSGWQRIDSYTGGPVMQYHPESGLADMVQPLAYIRRPQDTFLRFKTKYGIDQMLTPDHRVLCWKVTGRDRRHVQQVITAADFAAEHDRLTIGYDAVFETTFEPVITTALPLDDDQLRVQVMVMADAHLERGRIAVLHLKKERKIERARKLLDVADIAFSESASADATTTIRFMPPMPVKSYSGFWSASIDQLRVITDECLYWDGNHSERVFYARDRASADFIHYAFAAVGHRSVMRDDIDQSDGGIDYRVYAHPNTRVGMKGTPKSAITEVSAADGLAYCFTVPSGFLVLRRGGNIVVTGNCGMMAVETPFTVEHLPDNLDPFHSRVAAVVPSGMGKGHMVQSSDRRWVSLFGREDRPDMTPRMVSTAATQIGTLGSGNHFVELCHDETNRVWLMLHSGSRGIGNQLASAHIDVAKGLMARYFITLDDPDLSYLVEGTPEFDQYIQAMLWSQDYAFLNRQMMMDRVVAQFATYVTHQDFEPTATINVHHNYAVMEHHHGKNLWVTRKGAVRARQGELGILPGSMATGSYIVAGRGNAASYQSCAHGAGRRMSRTRAKKELDIETLRSEMKGIAWNSGEAEKLIDEDPRAYKDLQGVMDDQSDLVSAVHRLTTLVNYKGT